MKTVKLTLSAVNRLYKYDVYHLDNEKWIRATDNGFMLVDMKNLTEQPVKIMVER